MSSRPSTYQAREKVDTMEALSAKLRADLRGCIRTLVRETTTTLLSPPYNSIDTYLPVHPCPRDGAFVGD